MATVSTGSIPAKRILVYLQKKGKDGSPILGRFTQSVIDYLKDSKSTHETEVYVELIENRLIVTDSPQTKHRAIRLRRPPFCPISHLAKDDIERLPEATRERGIDVGAAVILESADNKVLLTRRAKTLRTFPSVWVPPGGHIEENETFIQAGLRELQEETGLEISPAQCEEGKLQVLALWESTYPPKLSLGSPKRHHIVVYLYSKLTKDLTSDLLFTKTKLEPDEADACGWFDRKTVEGIVNMREEESSTADMTNIQENFRALVIDDNRKQNDTFLPMKPLFNVSGDMVDCERVSTGTKFALEEWLKRT